MRYVNLSFYSFRDWQSINLKNLQGEIRDFCIQNQFKGTILIAKEGLNAFIAGQEKAVEKLKKFFQENVPLGEIIYKESCSEFQPFKRMLVKIKKEIITMGCDDIKPYAFTAPRVSAQELREWMSGKSKNQEVVLLDTRNDYEVRLGTFRGALDMRLKTFRQFPHKIGELPEDLKKKKIVTFCTGGIRCEKAAAYMIQKGFENVYQLDGGILKYFEEVGAGDFNGDCFVFDQRVAVDGALQKSNVVLCRGCQNPLTEEDVRHENFIPGKHCPYCINGKEHKEKIAQELAQKKGLM